MTTLGDADYMTPNQSQTRLDGVWNLRDLGGLPVASGGRTRQRRVFRSGTLWFATMQDCNVLARFQFDTVVDLRLPQEELHEEDWLCELLDLRYHHLPIEPVDEPRQVALLHDADAEHYVRLLDHNTARYVRALEIISDPDNHPVLFHCAAGADRTGLLAALVLACLDVDEAAIIDDYVAGDADVRQIGDRYRDHRLYGPSSSRAAEHRADGAVMAEFLQLMGDRAGIQKWALANGLTESALARMRAELIID
jgi:protein-tyrosine phosphatase